MSPDQQTLDDASIEVDYETGQTIMKFTKLLSEANEIEIVSSGKNLMLFAHGTASGDLRAGSGLGYHGMDRMTFDLSLSSCSYPSLS